MDNGCLAELAGVHKRYGKTVALDGVDMRVREGELLAVLGPNGAGKSTAISLLLGLERAESGSAKLLGQAPQSLQARRHVGVMMQDAFLVSELRVREHIDLVASYYPAPLSPATAMEMTNTTALADRSYGKLSGGQKRQVQFALAMCGRPKLLFLDEPTVGLDIQARKLMWASLRRLVDEGSSIVLTTHYLEEAEALADRVMVLAKGRVIASGTVNEIRSLVVRKQINCSTSLNIAQIQGWPEVESVTSDQQGVHITANNAEAVIRRLMAADDDVQNLEVHRAGLAEAFAELTA